MDLLRLELHGIVLRSRNALAEVDQVRQDEVEALRQRADLAAPVGARVGAHAVQHEQIRLARLVVIADVQRGRRSSQERIVMHIFPQMPAGMLILPAEQRRLLALGEDGMSSEEEKENEAHGMKVRKMWGCEVGEKMDK